jgi:hypothetical protein
LAVFVQQQRLGASSLGTLDSTTLPATLLHSLTGTAKPHHWSQLDPQPRSRKTLCFLKDSLPLILLLLLLLLASSVLLPVAQNTSFNLILTGPLARLWLSLSSRYPAAEPYNAGTESPGLSSDPSRAMHLFWYLNINISFFFQNFVNY